MEEKPSNGINELESTNDDIIIIINTNGEEIRFIEFAGINFEGIFYLILQPIKLLEGMEDDEALVFKVIKQEDNNEDEIEIVLDEYIINEILIIYNNLLDKHILP